MFGIFKDDKHGIWLKNKDDEVVLIERNLLDYVEDFLILHLIMNDITRQDAKQIVEVLTEYQNSIIAI